MILLFVLDHVQLGNQLDVEIIFFNMYDGITIFPFQSKRVILSIFRQKLAKLKALQPLNKAVTAGVENINITFYLIKCLHQ